MQEEVASAASLAFPDTQTLMAFRIWLLDLKGTRPFRISDTVLTPEPESDKTGRPDHLPQSIRQQGSLDGTHS